MGMFTTKRRRRSLSREIAGRITPQRLPHPWLGSRPTKPVTHPDLTSLGLVSACEAHHACSKVLQGLGRNKDRIRYDKIR
jgi:hypothetical protein